MKTKPQKLWLYWWMVEGSMWGPFLRQSYSTRRKTAKQLQAYDRENGWKVGRVHRMRVTLPAEVLK